MSSESKNESVDDAKTVQNFLKQSKEADERLHRCPAEWCPTSEWGFCITCELVHFPETNFVVRANSILGGGIRWDENTARKCILIVFHANGQYWSARLNYNVRQRCDLWRWYFYIHHESVPRLPSCYV
jgi:hypothetical protein